MKSRESLIEDYGSYMTLKNYSEQTISSYLRTVRMFYDYRKESKMRGRISQEHAKQYLLMRIKSGCSWSTINCDYSSLRKYFKQILNVNWSVRKIPRPQKERQLPEILSQKEVVRLIEHAPTYKHQIFLTFIYSTGLRLSEALNITVNDIDGERLQIRVNKGKGAKDRVVQIPPTLLYRETNHHRMRPMAYHNTDVTCSRGGRGISPSYDFGHSLTGLQSRGSKTQSILWIQANPISISYLHSALIVIS